MSSYRAARRALKARQMHFQLPARKLYLVAAPSGVGKSTLLSGVREFVVSTDALREQMLGAWTDIRGKLHRHESQNTHVFEVLEAMVSARAKERLTTFVDATSLTVADRARLAALAQAHGQAAEALLLTLPVEEALARNQRRAAPIPEGAIRQQYADFQTTGDAIPVRIIDMGNMHTLEVAAPRIPEDTLIDAVGDVHGLHDDLVELLRSMGYSVEPGCAPAHPAGRKLLFLGDFVDRGPQSIETLELVYLAVKAGHYAILGNHEMKLVRFWKAQRSGADTKLSLSSAATAMAFAALPREQQDKLGEFLLSLPVTLVWRNFGFAHANLVHYDPVRTPASTLLFGEGAGRRRGQQEDTDALYSEHCRAGINKFLLIRGHIEPTGAGQASHVYSLEARQAYRGELVALDMPLFAKSLNEDLAAPRSAPARSSADVAFSRCKTTRQCAFDFDEHIQPQRQRLAGLGALSTAKLVTAAMDPTRTLQLWKYSKSVFWDKLWDVNPLLLKARGLVLDIAGNVVAHPFDKVFNFLEEGAGADVADDASVIEIEKLNGFLAVVSPHPHKKDLLVTTTGSFESPFVAYIREYLPGPVAGRMLQYFHRNGPMSLMFEALHPQDPHIIEYGPEMHGLWLIGARHLEWDSVAVSEPELDEIAESIGVRRPAWKVTTFGQVKDAAKASRTEGVMVRDACTNEYVCKLKSPYYLTTKFLGRLSDKKARFMFNAPEQFKRGLDEEFFPVVDWLVTEFELEGFLGMEDSARVKRVREHLTAVLSRPLDDARKGAPVGEHADDGTEPAWKLD